jgi:hypothetical protein
VWHSYASSRQDKNRHFFKSFGVKKINELVVTSNKFSNNFAGLVTSGLGPDVILGPPVGPHWHRVYLDHVAANKFPVMGSEGWSLSSQNPATWICPEAVQSILVLRYPFSASLSSHEFVKKRMKSRKARQKRIHFQCKQMRCFIHLHCWIFCFM